MARNPGWSRDKLILALDLYFRIDSIRTSASNLEILDLSATLNELPIHMAPHDKGNFATQTVFI